MTPEALEAYPEEWAAGVFGEELAPEVARLVTTYSKYAARRKPELINSVAWPIGGIGSGEGGHTEPSGGLEDAGADLDSESDLRDGNSGSILYGGQFGRYVEQWRSLVESMNLTKEKIRPDQHSAWFQLVEFPILALSNLYEMYYAAAWNDKLAAQNDPRANYFADVVEEAYQRDGQLTAEYHALEDGKWAGMMSDVHMNYLIWQTPEEQVMPEIVRVDTAGTVDGSEIMFAPKSVEASGHKVIEASRFNRSFSGKGLEWTSIPHLGQSGAAIVALPQGQPETTVEDGVRVEYDFDTDTNGALKVRVHLTPTLDTIGSDGLRFGISLDDGPVTTLTSLMHPTNGSMNNEAERNWVMAVTNNGHDVETVFDEVEAGEHTLKLWRLDDNVVVERFVVER
jgi:hypothetical protein